MTNTPDFRALCAELIKIVEEHCNPDEYALPDTVDTLRCARIALATPPPKPPSDEELWAIGEDYLDDIDRTHGIAFARAALERWGR